MGKKYKVYGKQFNMRTGEEGRQYYNGDFVGDNVKEVYNKVEKENKRWNRVVGNKAGLVARVSKIQEAQKRRVGAKKLQSVFGF